MLAMVEPRSRARRPASVRPARISSYMNGRFHLRCRSTSRGGYWNRRTSSRRRPVSSSAARKTRPLPAPRSTAMYEGSPTRASAQEAVLQAAVHRQDVPGGLRQTAREQQEDRLSLVLGF